LAGLSGNSRAKVFAAKFNAELVAIADVFITGDQVAPPFSDTRQ
jgi:septum formation inhibitor MinC